MSQLEKRLSKIEAATHDARFPAPPPVRIIQDGALTPDQAREIAEANASGALVILRNLV